MVAAAESFSQPGGGGVGIPGFAMIGALSLAVTVANGNNTGVTTWTFVVEDVPPGSTVPTGTVQSGGTPTWTFTPDKPGTYVIILTVSDGVTSVTDTRTFHVPESTGQIMPGFQEISAYDNYPLNAGHNARGWATAVENWLRTLDTPLTTLTSGPVVLSSSNAFVQFNGVAGIAVTMPPASTSPVRRFYYFKNKTNQTNTINAGGGDTIDGGASLALTGAGAYAVLATDGSHNWMIISGEANSTTGGDATGPVTSMTVIGWFNKPLHSSMSAPNNLDVPQYDSGLTKWKSVAATSITVGGLAGGTAGQVYITNGTPAGAWTSLITVELTHGRFTSGGTGGDYKTVIGPLTGAETGDAAISFLPPATAPSVTNCAMYGNGVSTFINAPSSAGAIDFVIAGASVGAGFDWAASRFYVGGNSAAGPFVFDWATAGDSQFFAGSGQTLLTLGTVAAANIRFTGAGNTVAGIETTHGTAKFGGSGTDWHGDIGPDGANPNLEAAVWLLPPATARNGTNMSLLNNGSATYINTQGTFISMSTSSFGINLAWFSQNGIVTMWGLNQFEYVHNVGTPTWIQDARISDLATNDFVFQPQPPFATATGTNRNPGNFVVKTALPITGANFNGGVVWLRGDGTPGWRLGYYGGPDLTYTGMWFNDANLSNGSNYAFLGTATRTDLNATTILNLALGSAYQIQITGTPAMTMAANTNITNFVFGMAAEVNDSLPGTLTIQGRYAYSLATLGNRTPGNVVFDIGLPTNGGTTEASFSFTRNAIEAARIQRTASAQISLYLGQQVAFSGTNMALISDASTFTYVNTQTSGAIGMIAGDATFLLYIPGTQDHLYFLGTTTASPWYVDASTTTTPIISSGTSATSLTLQTNKSAASLVLKAAAATTIMTLTATGGAGTGNYSLVGSMQTTWRDSSANFTIDTTTTDKSIHITATQTMTAPTPTTGRDIDIIIEAFGGGDVTLTIAQHSTEKLNNVAASYVIVCTLGQVQGWKMRSNGTDWYIFPG